MTSTGKERRHFTLEKYRQIKSGRRRIFGSVRQAIRRRRGFQVSLHQMSWTGSCIMPCIPVLCQAWRCGLRPEATWKHGGLGVALDELPCMTSWKLGRCAKAEVSTAKFKSRPLQNFGNHSTGLSTILPSQVNQVLRNTPRTRSRTQHSLTKRLGPPSTPSLLKSLGLQPPDSWSPPLCSTCVSLCSPGDPLVPRSSRRQPRPRPRPRRRTT